MQTNTTPAKTEYSVRILVVTHKQYRMPDDPMYLPIHVGAALSHGKGDWKEKNLGYLKDNIGENISSRNPSFCELTALFWAWKHMQDDYIGLVHYRRHFGGSRAFWREPADSTGQSTGFSGASSVKEAASRTQEQAFSRILTHEELAPMLGKYKVFVPRKRYYFIESLYSHYKHTHYIDHLDKTRSIISSLYPEYVETFDEVMHHTSGHMFNMMIMERELLGEYCTWLFSILFALEKQVDSHNYSYFQGRYAGRVGELIFNVWLAQQVKSGRLQKDEIKVLPYLYTEKVDWMKKGKRFLRAKFLHEKYETHS